MVERMKIFVDVGAHVGQTMEEAVKERWGFNHIYSFEPMPEEFAQLSEKFGHLKNVTLYNHGLLDTTCERPMYGINTYMTSSVLPTMATLQHPDKITMCRFVEASAFIDELPEAVIVLKLNCEGSEIAILDNLINTGKIHRIFDTMIDPDILHTPGGMDELKRILARLNEAGFTRYHLCGDVMIGRTHQDRIANWLSKIPFEE